MTRRGRCGAGAIGSSRRSTRTCLTTASSREQLAGDLLPHPTLDQRIATGFGRNHVINSEGGIIDEEYRVEYVADRLRTMSTAWLGLTTECARCHDHKFDPITQRDYYQLFAFFNNVPEHGEDGRVGQRRADDPRADPRAADGQARGAGARDRRAGCEARSGARGVAVACGRSRKVRCHRGAGRISRRCAIKAWPCFQRINGAEAWRAVRGSRMPPRPAPKIRRGEDRLQREERRHAFAFG